MKVRKRDGSLVDFTKDKITKAIEKAMEETKIGVDHNLSSQISNEIFVSLSNGTEKYYEVEDIQDVVEFKLMDSERKDVAKRYII